MSSNSSKAHVIYSVHFTSMLEVKQESPAVADKPARRGVI